MPYQHHEPRGGDVENIGFEALDHLDSFQLVVERHGNDGVQRKPESRRVINREALEFRRRAFRVVCCDNVHFIVRLLQVREHLLVSVGVATDVREGSGLHHKPDFERRRLLERR